MPVTKPTNLARWAETAGGTPASNIVEPASGQKDTGWTTGQKPVPSSYFNWWQHQVYRWVAYLDDLSNQTWTWAATHAFNAAVTLASTIYSTGVGFLGQSGVNGGDALRAVGNGAGDGLKGTGGATSGIGVEGVGGATNGVGVKGSGAGSGAGVRGVGGSSNGAGVSALGGGSGAGVSAVGGASDGYGIYGSGGGSNGAGTRGDGVGSGNGVEGVAVGSGAGVKGTTAGTGPAGKFDASAGSGSGSNGIEAVAGGSGSAAAKLTGNSVAPALYLVPGADLTGLIGADGWLYYDSGSNTLKVKLNGAWKTITTS